MRQKHRSKNILYDVLDEDYLIVCETCYTQYHSAIRPSTTLDLVERARKAKQAASECEVCGHIFPRGSDSDD